MRFFNIDQHVSVIEDVKTQFRIFGHSVDSHLMSGHFWALDQVRASAGTGPGADGKVGYGSLNLTTCNRDDFFDDAPGFAKAAAWREENKTALSSYDGYIATYPPQFALLYEGLPGHTILDIPVRYEGPCFASEPASWQEFNLRLAQMSDNGKLSVVANSRYDAVYFEHFSGLPATYISSLCDYIDRFAPKWCDRGGKTLLAFGEHAGCRAAAKELPNVVHVRDALAGNYTHEEIVRSPGIVWIPYNVSIMSFFEHYWLGIPMFVPTTNFLTLLYRDKLALSQMTWHKSMIAGSDIEAFPHDDSKRDPHTFAGMLLWMRLYDFYNEKEFPHIVYFDSWDDLKVKIAETDLVDVSVKMMGQNALRRVQNTRKWERVLSRVKR